MREPYQDVEKVRQRRSRRSKVSTYSLVRLGLLASCGLAGPGSAEARLRLRAGERAFLNILPSSWCFLGLFRVSRRIEYFEFFNSLLLFLRGEDLVTFSVHCVDGLGRAGIQTQPAGFQAARLIKFVWWGR